MSVLQRGRVALTQGGSVVRGIYDANVSSVTGLFVPGEDVFWGASGAGKIVEQDLVLGIVRWYRTSGALPVVSNVLRNSGSTKLATISGFTTDSIPNFVTELPLPSPPRFLWVPGIGIHYGLTTAIDSDTLNLSAAYGEATDSDSGYAVLRDFTGWFDWILAATGDPDLASLLAKLTAQIEATVQPQSKVNATTLLAANWTSVITPEYWIDADGQLHMQGAVANAIDLAPATILTLPAGARPGATRHFAGDASGTLVRLEVTSAGLVRVLSGTLTTAVYLDTIHFRAEG